MFSKRIFKILAPLAMGALFLGSASPVFSAVDLNEKLASCRYVQKVNSFEVIFDASESMNEIYKGSPKMKQQKALINLFNDTIPNMKLTAAERAFGEFTWLIGSDTSKLLFAPTEYNKSLLPQAQSTWTLTRGKGFSPLDKALDGATADLQSQSGQMAVIAFSNGEDMQKYDPVGAAKRMKKAYGDRVCIYTVVLGNKADTFDMGDMNEGINVMKNVAEASISQTVPECGFMVTGASISTPAGMADFVEKIFLAKDSDCDGVADYLDKCPDTPKGCDAGCRTCPVDKDGCPLDSDGDGVIDCMDKCPDTPQGVKVDVNGCPIVAEKRAEPAAAVEAKAEEPVIMTLSIFFETGKSEIRPIYEKEIQRVADYMKAHPDMDAVIAGHTDNVGTKAANMKLSQDRVNNVKNSLVKNFNIDASRLEAVGYGESKPIVSNATKAGKQKNRRVTVIFTNPTK